MLRFASIQYLLIIPIAALAFALAYWYLKHLWKKAEQSFGKQMWPLLSSSLSKHKRFIKWGLEFLVLALFAIAMARPQMGMQKEKVKSLGVDLVLMVDVSNSMLTEDVKPSRLEHAKRQINQILDELAGDRVGLIVFAGSSVPVSPLTPDYSSIRLFADSLSTESVSRQGTNFEAALTTAKELLENGGATEDDASKSTKVLVFLSDGEDLQGGALKLAEELVASGMRIFSFAFGTEQGGSIPIRDANGYLREYKKDESGSLVQSKTKTDFLKQLADVGKGNFYFAVPGDRSAQQFAKDVKKLELSEFDSEINVKYSEYFYVFLICAIILSILEISMGERSLPNKIWRGRFEER